jgi:hypothetical protein
LIQSVILISTSADEERMGMSKKKLRWEEKVYDYYESPL